MTQECLLCKLHVDDKRIDDTLRMISQITHIGYVCPMHQAKSTCLHEFQSVTKTDPLNQEINSAP